MKRTIKRLTEAEYTKIKALIDYDIKRSVVMKATDRSSATVDNIRRSTDFADYRRIVNEYKARSAKGIQAAKKRAMPELAPGTPVEQANDIQKNVENLLNTLKLTQETLESLDSRLRTIEGQVGFIHDHIPVEAKNSRKFW